MRRSLFEKYGGFAKISRVVMAFYDKLLGSASLAPYFAEVDMKRLIDHQTKFVASVMGGPASYTNDHLERVHAHLGITDAAFQEVVGLMRETLEDSDFDEEDIQMITDALLSRRHFIVSKK